MRIPRFIFASPVYWYWPVARESLVLRVSGYVCLVAGELTVWPDSLKAVLAEEERPAKVEALTPAGLLLAALSWRAVQWMSQPSQPPVDLRSAAVSQDLLDPCSQSGHTADLQQWDTNTSITSLPYPFVLQKQIENGLPADWFWKLIDRDKRKTEQSCWLKQAVVVD